MSGWIEEQVDEPPSNDQPEEVKSEAPSIDNIVVKSEYGVSPESNSSFNAVSFQDDESVIQLLEQPSNSRKYARITTDFAPEECAKSSSSKNTKFRTIWVKNMSIKMPSLEWLPGEFEQIRGTENDRNVLNKFLNSVSIFRIISMMIYAETEGGYKVTMVTFSTPMLTICYYFHSKRKIAGSTNLGYIQLPEEILDVLKDPTIPKIMPGKNDWYYQEGQDHLAILYSYFTVPPRIENVIYIDNYQEKLHILPSGKDICTHVKLIHWIFQIKIDFQLHGNPVVTPLTNQWKKFADFYGKLLLYAYYALERKLHSYEVNPKTGVDTHPYYLEYLIPKLKLPVIKSAEEIRKLLIGNRKYPNPPLPDLPTGK